MSRLRVCFTLFFLMAVLSFLSSLNAQSPASAGPTNKKAVHPIPLLFDSCYWASDAPALLVNAICSRLSACCAGGSCGATIDGCTRALDGEPGKLMWDDFGLSSHENELNTQDLRGRIVARTVLVNTAYLCSCIDDITRISCDAIRSNYTSDYLGVESIIPNSGSWCSSILSVPPSAP